MAPTKVKSLTADQVVQHRTKDSLYLVIHDKVYDVTNGGQEVLIDQGGVDATEAFEEVGHSEEARKTLASLHIGNLRRQAGDEKLLAASGSAFKSYAADTKGGVPAIFQAAIVFAVGVAVFLGWRYLLDQDGTAKSQL
ncbi:hypothetical protein A1O3_04739 [Capronia epimyces CBS 606.96]|uniref:Cytochrome b5 heme-binding domain-containing protein n=1 Tax=Capronia epimyces CBS 606.96 TaxID=1182542 RepID=W9XU37_9EURO|nr:uncharacterized protein A1O3_04739 [Capronia epimyces CBS 606.96]EXJ84072.1 hypothetical protein A1O3_04739 [Capronia epimyces CBS 606.96]